MTPNPMRVFAQPYRTRGHGHASSDAPRASSISARIPGCERRGECDESVVSNVNTVITRRGVSGFGLLAAPLRVAAAGTRMAVTATAVVAGSATSAALLGGGIAASVGRSLSRAAPDVSALTRAAAGVAIEAIGGPPARRNSTNGLRRWIEVRGLGGQHASAIATDVLEAVRATPGVRQAFLNRTLARLVVTVDADGPSAADLCRIVADAEQSDRTRAARQHPISLPGDDALLMARMVAAAAAVVGLGLSLPGSLLRLPRLPDLVAVPPTLADHLPRVRGRWKDASGRRAPTYCSASSTPRPPR